MSTNGLPGGWTEIANTPADIPKIEEAIALLKYSYPPGQYDRLDVRYAVRTMIPRKINGQYILNLRIFLHDHDIVAFFFLRKRFAPPAYCLSPGALNSVAPQTLLAELYAMAQFLKNEPNTPGVDIVSETNPPVFAYPNLDNVYATALQNPVKLNYQGVITPGDPWPARLYRWEVI